MIWYSSMMAPKVGWMWASVKPGNTSLPSRSTTLVAAPTKRRAPASRPANTMSPSRTATAWTTLSRASIVWIAP